MDLKLIAKNLNEDCLSEIYSFVNRKKLCYDFLKQKREDIIVQGIMKPKPKTFQEGKYYTDFQTNMIGFKVLFIKKITKCFITYDSYPHYYHDLNDFTTEKKKRNFDCNGNEFIKETSYTSLKVNDFIELEKFPYCCYVLKKKFDFEEPPLLRKRKFNAGEYYKIMNWIENIKKTNDKWFDWKGYGEFNWLLNDLRKKRIKEAEDSLAKYLLRKSTPYNRERIVEKSEYIEHLKRLLE